MEFSIFWSALAEKSYNVKTKISYKVVRSSPHINQICANSDDVTFQLSLNWHGMTQYHQHIWWDIALTRIILIYGSTHTKPSGEESALKIFTWCHIHQHLVRDSIMVVSHSLKHLMRERVSAQINCIVVRVAHTNSSGEWAPKWSYNHTHISWECTHIAM